MKKFSLWVICLFCLTLLSGCGGVKGSAPAVVIDGDEISLSDMECYAAAAVRSIEQYGETELVWDGETDGMPTEDFVRRQALSIAVNAHVLARRAEELGLALTSADQAEIDARMNADIGGMGEENYKQRLAEEHFTEGFYRHYTYEIPYLQEKLWNGLFGEGEAHHPDDDAVRAYYRQRYRSAAFLLLSDTDETLLDKARAGEDFAALSEQYADILLMADATGAPVSPGQMGDAFQAALDSLAEGEVSGFVETAFGYSVIKRLPDDPDYCEANLESIRYAYCWTLFGEQMLEWEQAAVVETRDSYDSMEVSRFAVS